VHTRNTELIHKRCSGFRFSADNFANSLSYAHGDFIFLSDQDDIWNKDKIKIMAEQIKYFDLVMCNYSIIDNNDTLQRRDILKKNPVSKMFIKNLYNTPFLGCTMAFSRKALSYCLPFPRGVIGHDFWIGCIVCIKGTYKYIDKTLHLYRRHDLNVSSGGLSRSKNSFAFKILYRFVFIMQIIVRLLESSCAKGISNDYIFY
jgi:hypothetical protein